MMNLLALALLAAATNTQPANNGGSTSNGSSKTTVKASKNPKANQPQNPTTPQDPAAPQDGQTPPPAAKKKKGAEATEAPADGSPASIVGNSVDAATQIANEAAKAAMEEVKRLQAIGGGSGGGTPVDGKLVEAGVAGTAAVGKELTKAQKKKPADETSAEDAPKPEKKKKADQPAENSGDKKVFGKKPEPVKEL